MAKAFLEKKPLGKKDFEEGIAFGVLASWLWYLLWFGLSFYVGAKTHNILYVLGTMSAGLLVGMLWLKDIVRVFLRKD